MLKVITGKKFEPEKRYVIDFLLNGLLGFDYNIEFSPSFSEYQIILPNGNQITLSDSFFSKADEQSSYLNETFLPVSSSLAANEFTPEKSLPIIYGTNKFKIENLERLYISCDIDLFASAFFMLTRWEEFVKKERDIHDRFPGNKSYAFENNFLNRPVVNEYAEFLCNLLLKCGYNQPRKKVEFRIIPTHDIDLIYYPLNLAILGGDWLRTKSFLNPFRRIGIKLKGENPYDNYDWLMDLSEKAGTVSRFYFMSTGKSALDNAYDILRKDFLKIVERIKQRGHLIGFHPGFDTYKDPVEWKRQKTELEKVIKQPLTEGRQHYLRFAMPETFHCWEENGFEMDSTMGYADVSGYRCGTGNIFPVFDFVKRKKLNLKEMPLVLMDVSLHSYHDYQKHLQEAPVIIQDYIAKSKKYRMPFTLLFHNSSFDQIRWKGWGKVYTDLFL